MTQETKHTLTLLEAARNKDEMTLDYMRRVLGWIEMSGCNEDLPSIASVFELFEMISVTYDTSKIEEVYELIDSCGYDADPLLDFIKKWNMDWRAPNAKARGEA